MEVVNPTSCKQDTSEVNSGRAMMVYIVDDGPFITVGNTVRVALSSYFIFAIS